MRTAEFVFGLLGGVFGIAASVFALILGEIDASINGTGTSSIFEIGAVALVLSLIAIAGAIIVKSRPTIGGILMLVSAVGGLMSIVLFYLLPALLLGIGGLMALIGKKNPYPFEPGK
ncbi:DUF4064 domain-containing protein [Fictibacillus sp. Mic-4]|uniref:DUF4064 domain-containing protein n=1 Tax=Fictibacillus TaxID=1329200 RepID=UPI00040D397B|nr:DUF4064 domain-containing protein [Fictibacillus gelatini]